jgi:hypothetical protein
MPSPSNSASRVPCFHGPLQGGQGMRREGPRKHGTRRPLDLGFARGTVYRERPCTLEGLGSGPAGPILGPCGFGPPPSARGASRRAREAPRIALDPYELYDLRRLERAPSTPQALAFRARLLLRCARAPRPTNEEVAADLGCDPDTVSKWRRRFRKRRLEGLHDLPRSGRPAAFSP